METTNAGWCWDGKLNIMCGFQGTRYAELLHQILQSCEERLGIVAGPASLATSFNGLAFFPC